MKLDKTTQSNGRPLRTPLFRAFTIVLLGFLLGHLVVRFSLVLDPSPNFGLHNAVWRAEKSVDEKFGKDSFLYGVRRMGRVENRAGGQKTEAYIFDVEVHMEDGTERWKVMVDLTREYPKVFMGKNEKGVGTRLN